MRSDVVMHVDFVLHWGNKEWLAVHYGEFEEGG